MLSFLFSYGSMIPSTFSLAADTCVEISHANQPEKSWYCCAESVLMKARKNCCIMANNPKLTEDEARKPEQGF